MAGILDTFLLVFESDAKKLDDGLKKTDEQAKHVEHTVKGLDAVAEKMGEGLLDKLKEVAVAAAAVFALEQIKEQVFETAKLTDETGKLAASIGESASNVDAWSEAVARSGGSRESFQQSIRTLSGNLAQLDAVGTGRVAPFFEALGINLDDAAHKGKGVLDLLPELAEKFEGISKQKALGIGQKLGLDAGTITLLQMGRREVEAAVKEQKELADITQEDIDVAEKFNDQLDNTHRAFTGIWRAIGTAVLPALTAISHAFQVGAQFAREHSDFVIGALLAIGVAAGTVVVPVLWSLAAAAFAAFAPFLLIGAAVVAAAAAFALLYDDVMNFIHGNDSLIGQILAKYPIIGDIVGGIVEAFKDLYAVVAWVFNTIVSLLTLAVDGWRLLGGAIFDAVAKFVSGSATIQQIAAIVKAVFHNLGTAVTGVWDWIIDRVLKAINIFKQVGNVIKAIAATITSGLDKAKEATGLAAGQQQLAAAASAPLAAQTSASISNSASSRATSVSIDKVEVQTQAHDAEGISKAIGGTLGAQMRHAVNGMDDGVAG